MIAETSATWRIALSVNVATGAYGVSFEALAAALVKVAREWRSETKTAPQGTVGPMTEKHRSMDTVVVLSALRWVACHAVACLRCSIGVCP